MTLIYQNTRQRVFRRRERDGILGDGSGNVYASKSRYWVRIANRTDSDGNVTYNTALPMRYAAMSSIMPIEGTKVRYIVDYDDVLSIVRVDPQYFEDADIDSRTFNQAEPYDRFVYLKDVVRGLTRPVGSSAGTDSTLVAIREIPFFVDDYLDWWTYTGTPRAADKVDLASYVPAADTQRRVCIFFDTFQQDYFVTASTAQALTVALDSTDYDECFAALDHNEYIPLLSLTLSDAQSAITINDVKEDLRQFLNAPQIIGFPNPVTKPYYIRSTHQHITYDTAIESECIVEGDWVVN